MTTFDCPACHGHWAEGPTRDHRYDKVCRKCLQADLEALVRQGHVMDYPLCEDSGVLAVNGACPEHGGDACLIRPLAYARQLKVQINDLVRAKVIMSKSLKLIKANASTHTEGGAWYYTEANAALTEVESLDHLLAEN